MKTYTFYFIFFILLFGTIPSKSQNWIPLEGTWRFRIDSTDLGEQQHWENTRFSETIHLPGSTDEQGVGNHFPLFKSILGSGRLEGYPEDADFGMLTRKHKYIGKAWYQKEFTISGKDSNQKYTLFLERVMWQSKVWIDGIPAGKAVDYLSAPHAHFLGLLPKGKHVITVLVDNSLIHPIGTLGHSYCPHMQSQWNGIVGKIGLIGNSLLSIDQVDVYPSFKDRKIIVRAGISNGYAQEKKSNIEFVVKEKSTGKVVANRKEKWTAATGKSSPEYTITFNAQLLPWDEFTPELYQLETRVSASGSSQSQITEFGFRDLGVSEKHFTINGRKLIYRNSHEGMFFGKTGYPAMDVAYWKKIWKLYKDHGFNAARFHSSCPPEAAFVAADEVGLYLQVEFFWMDGWMGYKDLIGDKNENLNHFVENEFRQALKIYGNHPSMMLVSFGNELGGNFDKMGEWIATAKRQDSRRFYAAGIAHNITTADDYVEYGGKNKALEYNGTDWNYTENYISPQAHNYDASYRRKYLPEFTHEAGQYIVHPLWSEIDKYDGVFTADNLSYFKKIAEENGIAQMDAELQRASGNLNKMLYKAEIEATLRTPESAGYSLLSMVDYPGQGEALVGWVDPFYANKNFMTPAEFRLFGTHTAPLLRFSKYVWEDGELFLGKVEVCHYGKETLKGAQVRYMLKEGDKILKEAVLPAKDIKQGELTPIGEFSYPLSAGKYGRKLSLSLSITDTEYENHWDIWVFPKAGEEPQTSKTLVTASLSEALARLEEGGKVLLLAHQLGNVKDKTYGAFTPVFWSATWFEGQNTDVSGAFIRNRHEALQQFPTSDVMDWQWKDICEGARGFVLNALPKNYFPIVQPVNDFHHGNKIGTLFELKTKQGGQLLVCGYNIVDRLEKRPATRQLRNSLLHYVESPAFVPKQIVEREWLERVLTDRQAFEKEELSKNALLYIKAGAAYPDLGLTKWISEFDRATKQDGFDYHVFCDGIWQDDKGSYWCGKDVKIEIGVKHPQLMNLKIYFYDSNKQGRKGAIKCEDMPEVILDKHTEETGISIPVTRENCLDGKIEIHINCTSGPNLMISKLILTEEQPD